MHYQLVAVILDNNQDTLIEQSFVANVAGQLCKELCTAFWYLHVPDYADLFGA